MEVMLLYLEAVSPFLVELLPVMYHSTMHLFNLYNMVQDFIFICPFGLRVRASLVVDSILNINYSVLYIL